MNYMEWRGDVSFCGAPFNEVDNIILAMSVFADFSDIVPSELDGGTVAFSDAMKTFNALPEDRKYMGVLIPRRILSIPERAAECPRFAGAELAGFVNHVDAEEEVQFAALTFILPDDSIYIAYRGTDDTIVGWKEDMRLSFVTPIPAHLYAVRYLVSAAAAFPERNIRLGGHSKGGNLAMWAAAHCPSDVQERILAVYNNDGPGFLSEVLEEPSYLEVADRIVSYIPQSSLVGGMLERSRNFKIIKSTETAMMQHDPLSWEVMGSRFVYLDKRSKFGEHTGETLKNWVYSMSIEEKARLAQTVFSVIDSTGARTLTELSEAKVKNFSAMMKAIRALDKESRVMMLRMLKGLIGGGREEKARAALTAGKKVDSADIAGDNLYNTDAASDDADTVTDKPSFEEESVNSGKK